MVASHFPSSAAEALAMLYLQNQDIKDKSPEEIAEIFFNVKQTIQKKYTELQNTNSNARFVDVI